MASQTQGVVKVFWLIHRTNALLQNVCKKLRLHTKQKQRIHQPKRATVRPWGQPLLLRYKEQCNCSHMRRATCVSKRCPVQNSNKLLFSIALKSFSVRIFTFFRWLSPYLGRQTSVFRLLYVSIATASLLWIESRRTPAHNTQMIICIFINQPTFIPNSVVQYEQIT